MRSEGYAVVVMALLLSGCSVARGGLGLGQVDVDGGGVYAADGATPPDGSALDVDAGASGEDAAMPGEDAGTDSGVIAMDDAGSDAGVPSDAGLSSCPSPGVYSSVTGRCYRYVSPCTSIDGCPLPCPPLGMEAVWWTTSAEEDAIRALPGMFPLGSDATDLNCPDYPLGGTCTRGEYTWTHHPTVTPVVGWAGTSTSGTGAGLHADGMHVFSGGPISGGGHLCQSL